MRVSILSNLDFFIQRISCYTYQVQPHKASTRTVVILYLMATSPQLPPNSTVCIIGGGSSGVFAIQEALKTNFQPTLFEASTTNGGVWRSDNHWHSLTTNSSIEMMQVCGFPFPFKPSGVFPTRNEICKYIELFIQHYNLSSYIQYQTKVIQVRPTTPLQPTKTKWQVTTINQNNIQHTQMFDAVIVASGQFNVPKLPKCLQAKRLTNSHYQGTVLHSREFRAGADYQGLNVVVVGLGNSALDVALECSKHAKSVTVACRRGSIILPIRKSNGDAIDQHVLSRFFQQIQPKTVMGYRLMSEAMQVTEVFRKAGMPSPKMGGREAGITQRVSNLKEKEQWIELLTKKNSNLKLHSSGLKSVGEGKRVAFLNDSVLDDVDVVISCTGYTFGGFPFLANDADDKNDDNINDDKNDIMEMCQHRYVINGGDGVDSTHVMGLNLYRRIMHPKYNTLCFLTQFTGFANEAACGQLQARWTCNMWSKTNRNAVATASKIHNEIENRKLFWQKTTPLFPQFVTIIKYLDVVS